MNFGSIDAEFSARAQGQVVAARRGTCGGAQKRQGEPCLSHRVLVGLAEYAGQSLIYGIGDEIDIFRRTNQSR